MPSLRTRVDYDNFIVDAASAMLEDAQEDIQDLDAGKQDASAILSSIASGTYIPTLSNVANLGASTAYQCQYLRVGSTVFVSGRVDVDPTLPATVTQLGISLPVASSLESTVDCAGTAFASGIAAQGVAIRADEANNRAEMIWVAGDVTNQPMFFSFGYEIIA